MTLFAGLLCFSGEELGCSSVKDSQNTTTGQWYRSPRLRQFPRLHNVNSFSADHSLGVMLWVTIRPAPEHLKRFKWWIDWLGRNQRCVEEGCTKKAARFCPDDDVDGNPDAVLGCTLKPGDFAVLGAVVKHLKVSVDDATFADALKRAEPDALAWVLQNAQTNAPGYAQHLAAVSILLLANIGMPADQGTPLGMAALHISRQQPKNPFFSWLAKRPASETAQLALDQCPRTARDVPPETDRFQWSWQREDAEEAWKRTMLWECHFISKLLLEK
ncbi:hypothetical protein [Bradyrhizobium japonicum]|uniref:hypothetical protein n=1 Tax=Bradyrhizobium japonicum TaxID=375 RepID=UPI001BA98A0A|nr:hypothetical protein [Bradyrhizobium japonicum]MBR0958371.1 hypothetical protein [Bradyrhizobium japonicum]